MFFGSNATSGGVFGYLYLALGPNSLGHYYGSRFFWKLGQIPRVFRALEWLSRISGVEIMAKKNKFDENFCTHKPQSRME